MTHHTDAFISGDEQEDEDKSEQEVVKVNIWESSLFTDSLVCLTESLRSSGVMGQEGGKPESHNAMGERERSSVALANELPDYQPLACT